MSRQSYLIYQDIADPLRPIPVSETITVDKWFKDHPNPVLRKLSLSAAILAGSLFFSNTLAANIPNDQLPTWHPAPNQPYNPKHKSRLNDGETRTELELVAPPETITIDKWFTPIEQPRIVKTRQLLGGESRFEQPREILVSDWFREVNQPYFTKRRFYHTGETRFEIPRDILITDWLPSYPNQLKQPRRDSNFGEYKFERQREIYIDDWQQPTNQPRQIFSKLPRLHTGDTRTELDLIVVETITVDKWVQQTNQPYFGRFRRAPYIGGQYKFELPRTILISDWFREIQQPYFSKRRNYFTGQYKFELPRTILVTDWFQPVQQPTYRRKTNVQLEDYGKPDIRIEISTDTQLNEWYQDIKQPYFTKRRFYHTGESRFEVPRTILVSDWFQAIQQPRIVNPTRNRGDEGKLITDLTPPLLLDWYLQNTYQRLRENKNYATLDYFTFVNYITEAVVEEVTKKKGGGLNKSKKVEILTDDEEAVITILNFLLNGGIA
jgi:hypothetical protein